MLVRVSTYPGELSSVLLKDADSPGTLIATITGVDLVDTGGGAYTVNIGSRTGRWMLVLRDAADESLGITYASDQYPFSADYPPWLEQQPSYGPYRVTIHATDSDDNDLVGISIRLLSGSQSTTDETDLSGLATFSVSAGSWQVLISTPGFTYTPITLTVTDDLDQDIVLTALTATVPDDPMLCVVDYYVWGRELPLEAAKIIVRLDDNAATTNGYIISKVPHTATTDASGHATIQLVRHVAFDEGGTYFEEIYDNRGNLISKRRVTVPDLDYVLAAELTVVE